MIIACIAQVITQIIVSIIQRPKYKPTKIESIYKIFDNTSIPRDITTIILHDYIGYKNPSKIREAITKLRQKIKYFTAYKYMGYTISLPLYNVIIFILLWSLLYACYCGVIFLHQNEQHRSQYRSNASEHHSKNINDNKYTIPFLCMQDDSIDGPISQYSVLRIHDYNKYTCIIINGHTNNDWISVHLGNTNDLDQESTFVDSNNIFLSYFEEQYPHDFIESDNHYLELKLNGSQNIDKCCSYSFTECDLCCNRCCSCDYTRVLGDLYLSENGLQDSDFKLRYPCCYCVCCVPICQSCCCAIFKCCGYTSCCCGLCDCCGCTSCLCGLCDCCGCGWTVCCAGLGMFFFIPLVISIGIGLSFFVPLGAIYGIEQSFIAQCAHILDEIQKIDNEWNDFSEYPSLL